MFCKILYYFNCATYCQILTVPHQQGGQPQSHTSSTVHTAGTINWPQQQQLAFRGLLVQAKGAVPHWRGCGTHTSPYTHSHDAAPAALEGPVCPPYRKTFQRPRWCPNGSARGSSEASHGESASALLRSWTSAKGSSPGRCRCLRWPPARPRRKQSPASASYWTRTGWSCYFGRCWWWLCWIHSGCYRRGSAGPGSQ